MINYWIRYVAMIDKGDEVVEVHGELGLERDQPITSFEDIRPISRKCGDIYAEQFGLDRHTVTTRVIAWQRLEEPQLIRLPSQRH